MFSSYISALVVCIYFVVLYFFPLFLFFLLVLSIRPYYLYVCHLCFLFYYITFIFPFPVPISTLYFHNPLCRFLLFCCYVSFSPIEELKDKIRLECLCIAAATLKCPESLQATCAGVLSPWWTLWTPFVTRLVVHKTENWYALPILHTVSSIPMEWGRAWCSLQQPKVIM